MFSLLTSNELIKTILSLTVIPLMFFFSIYRLHCNRFQEVYDLDCAGGSYRSSLPFKSSFAVLMPLGLVACEEF